MAFSYVRSITIDRSKCGAVTSHSSFPALVSGTYNGSGGIADLRTTGNGGKVQNGSGYDVGFYSDLALTTKLDWETEKYTASTGEVVYWVRVPTMNGSSSGSDTVIYMAYGDSGISTDQSNKTGVWDSNYKAVYHMGSTSSLSLSDSTSSAYTLTNNNTVTANTGQIYGGSGYTAASLQSLTRATPSLPTGSAERTLSIWFKFSDTTIACDIVGWGANTTNGDRFALYYDNTSYANKLLLEVQGHGVSMAWTPDTNWHHLVGVLPNGASSSTQMTMYYDGASQSLTNIGSITLNTLNTEFKIGGIPTVGGSLHFSGSLDEARVSSIERASTWILAEYNNQSSPSTFYTVGTEAYLINKSDSTTVTESVGRMMESNRSVSDSTTIIDTPVVSIVVAPLSVSVSDTTTVSDFPAPATTGFQYKRVITIDRNQAGSSDSTNFPVVVKGTYDGTGGTADLRTTANGGKVYSSNGYDIAFYSDSALTTKLNWEIEQYTASTGAVVFWVQVPTVKSTAGGNTIDTTFYMAYGNANTVLIDQSNKTGVWDSNYGGVWHLPNGSSLTASDSTINANTGTITSATATTGQIDGGANFAGNPQSIDMGTNSVLRPTTAITLSTWFKSSSASAVQPLIWEDDTINTAPNYWNLYRLFMESGKATTLIANTSRTLFGITGTTTINDNTWRYLTMTWDSSVNTLKLYVNGASDATPVTTSGTMLTTTHSVRIGTDAGYQYTDYFVGSLDEIRISSVARSASWILAEYNNQKSSSTFFALSGEAAGGDLLIIASESTTVTESVGRTLESNISKSESTTISENRVVMGSLQISVSDSTTVTDFPTPASTTYQYKRAITVDHTQTGSSDSTNFPVVVNATYSYLATIANGGKVYNSNGYDIAFYSDSALTTKLNWETVSYTAASGLVEIWVQVPTLLSTQGGNTNDTTFYMAYGNASQVLIDQSNRTGVWDSNYKSVQHMGSPSSLSVADSTSLTSPTNSGTTAATGQIGGAASTNGSQSQSNAINLSSGTTLLTMEFWLYWTSFANNDLLAFEYTPNYGSNAGFLVDPNQATQGGYAVGTSGTGGGAGGNWWDYFTRPSSSAWHHYQVVFDKTNGANVNTVYLDGTVVSLTAGTHSNVPGSAYANSTLYYFSRAGSSLFAPNGTMLDEVRVSSGARSSSWAKASYNNQKTSSTFYTVGGELLLVTVSDTSSVSESLSVSEALQINKSDSTSVTDTPLVLLQSVISVSNSSTLTENVVVSVGSTSTPLVDVNDTSSISETIYISNIEIVLVSDVSSLTENTIVSIGSVTELNVNLSDATSTSELALVSIVGVSALMIATSENITATENTVANITSLVISLAVSDSVNTSESLALLIVAANITSFLDFFE